MFVKFSRTVPLAFALLAVTIAACSGRAPGIGPAAIPPVSPTGLLLRDAGPFAETPPVTPGEVLHYTNFYSGTGTDWTGPTASPMASPYSGATKITVTYADNSRHRIYASTYVQSGYTKTTYFGFAPVQGGGLQEITFSDSIFNGSRILDFFPNGALVAILPFAKGASWNDAAADDSRLIDGFGDGSQSMTARRDGSYFAQMYGLFPYVPKYTITLKPEGSGNSTSLQQGYSPSVLRVSLPKRENGRFVIDGTTQQGVPFPKKRKRPQPFVASDWYPGNEPQPLYTDSTRVMGSVRTPRSCKTQANLSATETIETYYRLDPIEGYDIISKEVSYYRRDGTAACQIRNITMSTYDDTVLGAPISRIAETDRYVLTSAKDAPAAIAPALAAMPIHPFDPAPELMVLNAKRSAKCQLQLFGVMMHCWGPQNERGSR